jgi:hypothetical protein
MGGCRASNCFRHGNFVERNFVENTTIISKVLGDLTFNRNSATEIGRRQENWKFENQNKRI